MNRDQEAHMIVPLPSRQLPSPASYASCPQHRLISIALRIWRFITMSDLLLSCGGNHHPCSSCSRTSLSSNVRHLVLTHCEESVQLTESFGLAPSIAAPASVAVVPDIISTLLWPHADLPALGVGLSESKHAEEEDRGGDLHFRGRWRGLS